MKSRRNFIKNNPDIIFTRDKGNTTVILERKDYLKKMTCYYTNTYYTYTIIKRDLTNNDR